jgi:hypothetical protein
MQMKHLTHISETLAKITRGPLCPEPASRRRGGASDAQPGPEGGGDTETRQQKARREMQHPIYF